MRNQKCLFCEKPCFTPSAPHRKKKYCDNFCQNAYEKKMGTKIQRCGLSKEYLENLYINERKSTLAISKVIGKSAVQVSRYLRFYKIPTRPFSTKGLQTRLGAILSEETKAKIRKGHLGKKIPAEVRRRMGSKGSKNPGYIDGRTPLNKRVRHSVEYRLWRESVFNRDNWVCQFCGERGGELNADHIKPFAHHPELRFVLSNGRTLCVECHKTTDTFGRKSNK